MGMFQVVQARPNDVDRLWSLLDEDHRERAAAAAAPDADLTDTADPDPVDAVVAEPPVDDRTPADALPLLEARRDRIVALVSDPGRPVLLAYSGIRAVGFALVDRNGVGGRVFTSAGWRGLGVEEEIRAAAPMLLR
ncbi:hypothetical protein BFL36_03065 [Clavibacter michiganensis]|uniref:GNAT family N-acetyltransferase n=1 Tax=Clavibacter michiganensis TaxID=28447 RepID=A0A251YRI0_9MICO|nr:hypothetical protein [Clavibacter michiganensis]OUE26867.1 hypothetical protein BFL36_03065 [Clavibacter michiganensis]